MRRTKQAAPIPVDAALTVDQARALLGIGRYAMNQLIARGEVRSFFVTDRNRRIRRSAIDAFIARREAECNGNGNGNGPQRAA